MDLLLDTHIALWALDASPRLSAEATTLLLDPKNTPCVSVVSGWEVSIKHLIDPSNIALAGSGFLARCREAGYRIIDISENHIEAYDQLDSSKAEGKHKDPFDRMLIAQSKADSMLLVTHDKKLQLYNEPLVCVV